MSQRHEEKSSQSTASGGPPESPEWQARIKAALEAGHIAVFGMSEGGYIARTEEGKKLLAELDGEPAAKPSAGQQAQKPTVEEFRRAAQEQLQRSNGNPESLGILLRHYVHPHGYELAFDFMRVCAELTGEPLTEAGVWERGARGELWLVRALEAALVARKQASARTVDEAIAAAEARVGVSLGQVAYDAYGNHPGPHGAWKTYDGRPMPVWPDYSDTAKNPGGPLTQERWEVAVRAAASAVLTDDMLTAARVLPAPGMEWDAFANKYVQKGPKSGPAINTVPVGA